MMFWNHRLHFLMVCTYVCNFFTTKSHFLCALICPNSEQAVSWRQTLFKKCSSHWLVFRTLHRIASLSKSDHSFWTSPRQVTCHWYCIRNFLLFQPEKTTYILVDMPLDIKDGKNAQRKPKPNIFLHWTALAEEDIFCAPFPSRIFPCPTPVCQVCAVNMKGQQ